MPSTDELLCPTLEEDMHSGKIVMVNMKHNKQLAEKNRVFVKSTPTNLLGGTDHPTYFFAHDRIQQAATLLLSDEQQISVHLRLAEVSFKYIFISKHNCVWLLFAITHLCQKH